MQTVLIVAGTSVFLLAILAIAHWGANFLMRVIPPGRMRDFLVLPHTERKDWLLAWLPIALFLLLMLILLHFNH